MARLLHASHGCPGSQQHRFLQRERAPGGAGAAPTPSAAPEPGRGAGSAPVGQPRAGRRSLLDGPREGESRTLHPGHCSWFPPAGTLRRSGCRAATTPHREGWQPAWSLLPGPWGHGHSSSIKPRPGGPSPGSGAGAGLRERAGAWHHAEAGAPGIVPLPEPPLSQQIPWRRGARDEGCPWLGTAAPSSVAWALRVCRRPPAPLPCLQAAASCSHPSLPRPPAWLEQRRYGIRRERFLIGSQEVRFNCGLESLFPVGLLLGISNSSSVSSALLASLTRSSAPRSPPGLPTAPRTRARRSRCCPRFVCTGRGKGGTGGIAQPGDLDIRAADRALPGDGSSLPWPRRKARLSRLELRGLGVVCNRAGSATVPLEKPESAMGRSRGIPLYTKHVAPPSPDALGMGMREAQAVSHQHGRLYLQNVTRVHAAQPRSPARTDASPVASPSPTRH